MTDRGVDDGSLSQSIRDIFSTSVFFMFSTGLSKVLGFLLTLVFTHQFTTSSYGLYAYAMLVVAVFGLFSDVGSRRSLARFLSDPSYDSNTKGEMVSGALTVASVIGFALSILLYVAAPSIATTTLGDSDFVPVLRVVAPLLAIQALLKTVLGALQGFKEIHRLIAFEQVLRPGLRLCFVVVAVLTGIGFVRTVAMIPLATAFLLVLAAAALLATRRISVRVPRATTLYEYFRHAVPISLANIETIVYNQLDVLLIGIVLAASDVAVYKVASLVSALITLPLLGSTQLFGPTAVNLYAQNQLEQLSDTYATITKWVLGVALLAAAGIAVYRSTILGLFGSEYRAGSVVILLLLGAQAANAAAGPANQLLGMTDNQYLVLLNNVVFGVVNLCMNLYLLPRFGIVGAATATGVTIAALNVVRVFEVAHVEGIVPYRWHTPIPIVGVAAATAVMLGVQEVLSSVVALLVGGILGVLSFCTVVYLFGLTEHEREVVQTLGW